MVLVGEGCRLRAPRVDDDDAAAARLEGEQAAPHAGDGHQAAVGRERVCANDDQVLRPVDVGNRQQQLVAEHVEGRDVVRQLVH